MPRSPTRKQAPASREQQPFDLVTWAESSPREFGTKCRTCGLGPELNAQLDRVLELIAGGESAVTIPQLWRKLTQEMDFPVSENGFRGHVRRCRPELYERISARRG